MKTPLQKVGCNHRNRPGRRKYRKLRKMAARNGVDPDHQAAKILRKVWVDWHLNSAKRVKVGDYLSFATQYNHYIRLVGRVLEKTGKYKFRVKVEGYDPMVRSPLAYPYGDAWRSEGQLGSVLVVSLKSAHQTSREPVDLQGWLQARIDYCQKVASESKGSFALDWEKHAAKWQALQELVR